MQVSENTNSNADPIADQILFLYSRLYAFSNPKHKTIAKLKNTSIEKPRTCVYNKVV